MAISSHRKHDPNAITSKIITIPALVLIASDQLEDSGIWPSANQQQPSHLRGWGMAETEQRFTLHARSRKSRASSATRLDWAYSRRRSSSRSVIPRSGGWEEPSARSSGWHLAVDWSMDRRRRVKVTEQQVTVVNSFSRYVVAWHELSDVEFERIENQAGGTAYHRLAFVTPSRRIVAEAPAGSERELMKFRDRILHAHELSPNEPQSDVGIAVEGAATLADRLGARLSKFPRLRRRPAQRTPVAG
jgi:hypothetical protein